MPNTPKPLGIWPVRRQSEALALRLATALNAEMQRPWLTDTRQTEQFAAHFHAARGWVFIGAAGITTRFLAGLPASKRSDPAVVVLDDAARFAIPLLGGHEGGGNALAYAVARITGAVPVITTATEALKPLTLGIGCRRGVDRQRIENAVLHALAHRRLDDVREVATIDLKATEPGLLAFCAAYALPLRVFAQRDIAQRPLVGHSDWVQQNIGVSGVCQPCALLASPRGRLLVPKLALGGVTVAVVEDWDDMHNI